MTGRLRGLKVSEVICLPLVFLRVLKYSGEVDVELSFSDLPFFEIGCVMIAMQSYANALSNVFRVERFYGGLEPALDVETRYFTGTTLGPLH